MIVLYLENHSFDNLYGEFPGAEGLASQAARAPQTDSDGSPYSTLPPPAKTPIPKGLPNRPFAISDYVPADRVTEDLVHRFYQEQMQIDGGRMDKFAAVSDAKGLSLGYYHTRDLPLYDEARNYVLCDHFFHSAFGGSFLNHIWLIAAQTPQWEEAPKKYRAQLDSNGSLIRAGDRKYKDGIFTPDGFAVNTVYSVNQPHPANEDTVKPARLLPNLTFPTIGDRLTEKDVRWAWFSGGWDSAMAGHPAPTFQFHHQPFVYFARYADGTAAKKEHLKDEDDFLTEAKEGTLPEVSFVKPLGIYNEHPGYTDIVTGERHALQLINAVRNGPQWKDCAIIVTYDEHGGFRDHVAPPKADRWGPGTRVPTLIISPFAKRGFVDTASNETLSILALIEHQWGIQPLSSRDSAANDLREAFEGSRRP